jgi:hypothetical protein
MVRRAFQLVTFLCHGITHTVLSALTINVVSGCVAARTAPIVFLSAITYSSLIRFSVTGAAADHPG